MTKQRHLWKIAAGVGVLAVLCILVSLAAGVVYFTSMQKRAFNSRPLVLIHSPRNHEQVPIGERVSVHATGHAVDGLLRLELWSGDELMAMQEAPESHPTTMVLATDWMPTVEGVHVLVVRAVGTNGVEGQATIAVQASAQAARGAEEEVSREGETSGESPADEAPAGGIDEESPAGHAEPPSADGEAPVAEPPTGEAEPLPEGGEPPVVEPAAPAEIGTIQGIFFGPLGGLFGGEGEPLILRLEVPALQTGETYDSLHCYVQLASSPPQWYPDEDGDPTTDELFASLGAGSWDSAAHLAGENAPSILWTSLEPLPLTVSCVGILGGLEALELGHVELRIPPEQWNGSLYPAGTTGAEGSFDFSYRVSRGDVPLVPDRDMTAPVNARLDDRRIALHWDYLPADGEAAIDGFRVYLNGNLQWTEPAEARESGLPYEWFNPPCGSTYTFGVTAYRAGFPDGPESQPSEVALDQPLENCTREIQIVFQTLETFDLGGDRSDENRFGDVGPAYGYFFANEKQITFHGGDLGPGLDMPSGLQHNTVYDLSAMTADPTWRFSGTNSTIVDVVPGGTFQFGFHINDQDAGRCDHSGDPGCDDLICEGFSVIYEDHYGQFDRQQEGAILSDDGRCRLAFAFNPAAGSPVGSGDPGWEPLPWIEMQQFDVDEATGKVQIHVRNTGTATWPWRDLAVELQNRDGSSIGIYTWPEFVLEAGQETVLEHPDMILSAPFDACVRIDPLDAVVEEYERSGTRVHNPICPRLPDLTISNLSFEPSGGGRVHLTVQNVGEAALENRTLAFGSVLADGSPAYLNGSWPGVTLEPLQTRSFDLTGVTEATRARLAPGYSITVNPEGTIAEADAENNTYTVRGNSRMRLRWCNTLVPHYYGYGHTVRMDMTLSALSGANARTLLTHHLEDYFSYLYVYSADTHYLIGGGFPGRQCNDIDNFEILGDEQLQVTISGQYQAGSAGSWDNLGSAAQVFSPQGNWGADVVPACSGYDYHVLDAPTGWHNFVIYPEIGMLAPRPWMASYHLCLENPAAGE